MMWIIFPSPAPSLHCHFSTFVKNIRKRLLAPETPKDTQSSLGVSGDSKLDALAVLEHFDACWDVLGMSQHVQRQLNHLKTAKPRWPFPDEQHIFLFIILLPREG